MFEGYLGLGGKEIGNTARVVAYVTKNFPAMPLGDCLNCGDLAAALGDSEYESPAVDTAPWVDPTNPASAGFFGFMPLEITGIDDSTRQATVVESIGPGGNVGQIRYGTKGVYVRGMLVARDALALSAGASWLERALAPELCNAHGGSCGGASMCYFVACPEVCDMFDPAYGLPFGIPVNVDPGTTPLIMRELAGFTGMFKGRLNSPGMVTSPLDGVILRWGLVDRSDVSLEIEEHGPVVLQRTNHILNPNFTIDLSNWSTTGAAIATREPVGGADGGPYAVVEQPAGDQALYEWTGVPDASTSTREDLLTSETVTNLAQNPSFETASGTVEVRRNFAGNPSFLVNATGWLGFNENGSAGSFAREAGAGFSGLGFGRMTFTTSPSTPGGGARYDQSVTGLVVGAMYTYTMMVNPEFDQEMQFDYDAVSGGGHTFGPTTHCPAGVWTPVSITVPFAAGTTALRLRVFAAATGHVWAVGETLDVDALLIEAGPLVRPFFDGATAADGEFIYAWVSTAGNSASTASAPGFSGMSAINGGRVSYQSGEAAFVRAKGLRALITTTGQVDVQVSVQNPATGTFATMVLMARANDRDTVVTPRIRGGVAAESTLLPVGVWTQVRGEMTVGGASNASTGFRVASGSGHEIGDTIDVDLVTMIAIPSLAEPYSGPPFDGDSPDGVGTFRSAATGSFAGPNIVSFAMRSVDNATVTARLRSSADDSVLATASISPTTLWQRYSFGAAFAESAYLELDGSGTYALDQVVLETGAFELDFFDGSTPVEGFMPEFSLGTMDTPEWEIEWLGAQNASASRATWLGEMTVGVSGNVDFWETLEGACEGFPFVDTLQGEFTSTGEFATRTRIPTDVQIEPYQRTMHDVTCIDGPRKLQDLNIANGAMREVGFTLVAGHPFAYGSTQEVIAPTVMAELPTTPWGPDVCEPTGPTPIIDPDCVTPPAPPRPPAIPNACVVDQAVWQRYWLNVPATAVSLWSEMAPTVTIRSEASEIRQIRVRVFPNPFDRPIDAKFRESRMQNGGLKIDGASWQLVGGLGVATGRLVGGSPWCGINYWRATAAGAHTANLFGPISGGTGYNPVSPGELVRPSAWLRPSVSRDVKLRYYFVDGAGVTIGTVQYGQPVGVAAGLWIRAKIVGDDPLVVPAGAVGMFIGGVGDGAAWANGQTLDIAGAMVEVSNAWGDFEIDTWWDADRLDAACQPMPADGFYYASTAVVIGETSAIANTAPVDPCTWCSEFVLSYLPPNTELTVDAITERAFATVVGQDAQPADTLLYGSDGGPMTWPALSCGISYIFAIDVPEPLLDDVTVGIDMTRRE